MNVMLTCLLLAVLAPLWTHGSESYTLRVGEKTGTVGSSVILPCWLDTPQDIQDMEIRWYRPQKFNTPVLFYSNHEIKTDVQDESYRNRSSLALREPQSAGLKGGDLSLKLENLKIDDNGTYHCYVSGLKGYGSNHVDLVLNVPGSPPLLSLQLQDDGVNISCSSCGWRPKPNVAWKYDKAKTLRSNGSFSWEEKDKLTCIRSWVLLSPSDSNLASCYVSAFGIVKDSNVNIQNLAPRTVPKENGSAAWKALFAVAVLVVLAMIAVSIFLYKKYNTGYMRAKTDEEAPASACSLDHRSKSVCEDQKKDAVDISFDTNKANQDLIIKDKVVRDSPNAAGKYSGPGFPFYLSVYATRRFNSGRAYWEVGLTATGVPVKKNWLIGVCEASNIDKTYPTPSNGFWFLYSDGQNGIQVNTEPKIFLTVDPTPEKIGVLLDYDNNELSFYNANEGVHLFTMKTKFQGDIVPMFNPAIGDPAPLTIIPKQSEPKNGTSAENDTNAETAVIAASGTDQPTQ